MPFELESGLYQIHSLSIKDKWPPIGRSEITNASNLPKAILVHLEDIRSLPPFELQKVTNNRFWIRSLGDPLADIDGKLFAVPRGDFEIEPQEWELQEVPQFGPDAYIIAKVGGSKVWLAPEPISDLKQITLGTMITAAQAGDVGIPYSPNEVFIIKRVFY